MRRTAALLPGVAEVAMALVVLPWAFAAQPAAPPAAHLTPAAAATEFGEQADSVPAPDIKVHGHWTIEVLEPNGELASRTEFDNALKPNGKRILTQLLARQVTLGKWFISIQSPCWFPFTDQPGPCILSESDIVYGPYNEPQNWSFNTLSPQVTRGGTFVMSGTARSDVAGQIDYVSTMVWNCDWTVDPTFGCRGQWGRGAAWEELGYDFSSRTYVPNSIPFADNQIINVTVEFSFS